MTFEEFPSWELPLLLTGPASRRAMCRSTMRLCLEGEIVGPNTDKLRASPQLQLTTQGGGRLRLLAAHGLRVGRDALQHVSQLHTQGRAGVFKNVNSMVAALMQVMGLHQVARIELRNPPPPAC